MTDRVDAVLEMTPGADLGVPATGERSRLARLIGRQPLGLAGALIVLVLVVTAALAPVLAPHGPKDAAFAAFRPPGAEFPMGTDQLGRDQLSRVIWGARLSLYVGLVSVAFGVTLGGFWGVVTGYFGGRVDGVSQRVVDILMALPPIILALSLMAALGQSINNVILALTVLLIPTAARTLRAQTLVVKEHPYVEAARAAGSGEWRVVLLHVVPNTFATYIVLFTVNIAYAIVVEASLSFLGLGAPPDEPSWGGMLTAGTQSLEAAPWMIFFPGAAISLTVFGLNLLGDAIRDLTDPRLRGGLG
ncbi:MAG: ABC transporter permease [Candidatus Rokubacteria bacterium]|nr:ABC transporter permease [Candidatus Rokubacteria bacterium]